MSLKDKIDALKQAILQTATDLEDDMQIAGVEADVDSATTLPEFRTKLVSYNNTYGDALMKQYTTLLDAREKQNERNRIVFRPTSSTTQAAQQTRQKAQKVIPSASPSMVREVMRETKKTITNQDAKYDIAKSLIKKTRPKPTYEAGSFQDYIDKGQLGILQSKIQQIYEQTPPTIKEFLNQFVRYKIKNGARHGRPILGKLANPPTIGTQNYRQYRIAKQLIRQIKNAKSLLNSNIQKQTDEYINARANINKLSKTGNPIMIANKLLQRMKTYDTIEGSVISKLVKEKLENAQKSQLDSILAKVNDSSASISALSDTNYATYKTAVKDFNSRFAGTVSVDDAAITSLLNS